MSEHKRPVDPVSAREQERKKLAETELERSETEPPPEADEAELSESNGSEVEEISSPDSSADPL